MDRNVLTYPLSYLSLKDERGRRLYQRNFGALFLIVVMISFPFIFFNANYFGDKGFLDRFGSFSAVLTGFYIAALVGVASFASMVGDLDEEISVGKIIRPDSDGGECLTRRQYVCSMFGYLSFVSLGLSVGAILLIVAADPVRKGLMFLSDNVGMENFRFIEWCVSILVIVGFNLVLSHLLVTTCHGLYYLIDRLYATKPKILPKNKQ
nr:hypothetical protein [Brucella anthropi]